MKLQDKVAVVTGAGSGIGRAMALLFSREGAAVAAVDRDADGLAELQGTGGSAGGRLLGFEADVTQAADCAETIGEVLRKLAPIDILCNNAGTIRRTSVLELSEEEWNRDLATNLTSVFLWSKEVLPGMIARGRGVILNTASGWGLTGGPRAASYCASKGGVVQLTRSMAIDHGPQGVRVNCICPGDTDTPMLRQEALQLGHDPRDLLAAAIQRPLGRVGTAEEVAQAALFLVSDEASWITGTSLVIDGGGLAGG